MAYLRRTTGQQRNGVRKGGGGAGTGGNEYGGREGRGPTGQGTDKEQRWERRASRGKERGPGKKKDRWWGPLRRNRGSTEEKVPIKFSTYNIRNGRNGGLEAALRGMAQANIDLGIFQETKCTDGVYTRASAGYRVVAIDAPIRHRGGIKLF